LWTYRENSFLPHGTWRDADAAEQPIVLVCKTDRRSANAASALLAAGAQNVAVLRGGTDGWHAQGLPLE